MSGFEFPSKEWAEEFCKKLNENEKYRSSAKRWEGSIMFKVSTLPPDLSEKFKGQSPAFVLDLWHGECRGYTWYDDASQGDADYILSASYEDWIKIIEGKLDPIKAMVSRKMKVEKGSIATIMRFTLAAINMVKTAQQVPIKK